MAHTPVTNPGWYYPSDTTAGSWAVDYGTSSKGSWKVTLKYDLSDPLTARALSEEAFFANQLAPLQLSVDETYHLPDGSRVVVDGDGNWKVEDQDAKVRYKANNFRDFSPHLNASDRLAEFMEYVAGLGVRSREDALNLPIRLFISWLVVEAAERDGDQLPEEFVKPDQDQTLKLTVKPKCLYCGRFIKRLHQRSGFPYCEPLHAQQHLTLQG